MSVVESVKNGYFKIEDKWFDLLDFLDSKSIPVYSVVDPVEKAGVPSLPLFIALVLIASYFLLGGAGSVFGTPTHELTLSITDSAGNLVDNAYVELLKGTEKVYSASVNGTTLLTLPIGEYLLHASAFGCDDLDNYSMLVDSTTSETSITLNCQQQPLAKTVRVCFSPNDNLGNVNMKEKGGSTTINCNNGSITCDATIDATAEKKYSFKTSTDFVSDYYSGNELITMENNYECVKLFPYVDPNVEEGKVLVTAKNQNNERVGGVIIQLLKPNSSYVLDEKTTYSTGNKSGTASFYLPVGTTFTVKAQPSNSTAVYADDKVYNVTSSTETLFVDITLNPAAPTNVSVIEKTVTGTIGVAGASVMVYDSLFTRESQLGPFFTNADGLASIGLDKGAEYNIVVYKPGYLKTQATIKGGEEKTITLEKALPNETGDITAYVVFSDTQDPIPDVQVELYKDGKPTGIPAISNNNGKTDYTGKTSFLSVPIGTSYCAKAIRPEGESECVDVNDDGEVKNTKYNEVAINIPRKEFQLFVDVTVNGSKPKSSNQPSVKAVDKFTGEEVSSATVSKITGIAELSIPEDTNIEIIGEYSNGTGYYTASKDLGDIEAFLESNKGDPMTTLDLKKVENKISIDKITGDNIAGSSNKENVKGKQYQLTLSIGTSNETKWDEIKAVIANKDDAVEFLEPQSDYVDSVTGEGTNTLTLSINPVKADGKNLEITVPFRVKTTAKTGETNISYSASWKKSNGKEVKDPKEGAYKKGISISGCTAVPAQGGLSVCVEKRDSMAINTMQLMRVTITNEGQSVVNSNFEIAEDADKTKLLLSRGSNITKNGNSIDYSLESTLIKTENPVRLEHGDKVTIIMNASAFETGDAKFLIKKDGAVMKKKDTGEDFYFGVSVTGQQDINFIVQPSNLYDLTNSLNLSVSTSSGILSHVIRTEDWAGTVTISGSALDCGGNSITTDPLDNVVTGRVTEVNTTTLAVNFDSSCRLREGALEISISNNDDYSDKTTTINVEKSAVMPTAQALLAPPDATETIEVKPSAGDSQEDFTVTSDNKGYWTEAMLEFKKNTDYDSISVKAKKENPATLSQATISATPTTSGAIITFSYGSLSPPASSSGTILLNITIEKQAGTSIPGTTDYIKSDYIIEVPITVKRPEPIRAETATPFFTGLPIQKLTDTDLDCSTNYCNMIQAFSYLEGNSFAETNLLLVDPEGFTPQDLEDAWNFSTSNINVKTVNSESDLESGERGVYSDGSKFSLVDYGGSYSFNKLIHNGYFFLRSISKNSDTGMVQGVNGKALLASKVQLLMPYSLDLDHLTRLKSLMSTEVISDNETLKTRMENVIKEMWGVSSNTYQSYNGAIHKVVLVKCNSSDEDSMAKEYCTDVNTMLGSDYGANYTAVILPEGTGEGTVVIFAGETWDEVRDLVKRFNNTVNGGKNTQLSVKEIIDTEGNHAGSVLVRPSKTITYVCQEKIGEDDGSGNIIARTSDCSLSSSVETALKEIYSNEASTEENHITPEEVRINKISTEEDNDWNDNDVTFFIGLCADEGNCSATGDDDFSYSITTAYNAMGITQPEFSVPEGGAFFKLATAPQYRAYAHSIDELTDLLNAYAGGQATAVGGVEPVSDLSQCPGDSDYIGTIGGTEAGGTLNLISKNGKIAPNEINATITISDTSSFKEATADSCFISLNLQGNPTSFEGVRIVKDSTGTCYIMTDESSRVLNYAQGPYHNIYFYCSKGDTKIAGDPINIQVVQGS